MYVWLTQKFYIVKCAFVYIFHGIKIHETLTGWFCWSFDKKVRVPNSYPELVLAIAQLSKADSYT